MGRQDPTKFIVNINSEFSESQMERILHRIDSWGQAITEALHTSTSALEYDMSDIADRLAADVQQQTDVITGVQSLLSQLAQEVRDAGTDATKLAAVADQLEANSGALAQAVVDNTPAGATPVDDGSGDDGSDDSGSTDSGDDSGAVPSDS